MIGFSDDDIPQTPAWNRIMAPTTFSKPSLATLVFEYSCIDQNLNTKHTYISSGKPFPGQNKDANIQTVRSQLPILELQDRQFSGFTGISKQVFQFLSYRVGARVQDSPSLPREQKLLLAIVKIKCDYIHFHQFGSYVQHQPAICEKPF